MAANTSWAALGKATDLRNRIFFTLGLLIVYRLGTFIPVPGIDGASLREFMEGAATGIGGILSMFTGGARIPHAVMPVVFGTTENSRRASASARLSAFSAAASDTRS